MVDTKIITPIVAVSILLILALYIAELVLSVQTYNQMVPLIGIAGLAIVLWVIYQPRKKLGWI